MTRRPVFIAPFITPSTWPLPAKALVMALTTMMAGCTWLAPPYQQPALPVPATYPDTYNIDSDMPALPVAASIGWQDYFTDPVLRRLIADSLQYNRDLRLAIQRVDEARAMYGIRRADQFPTIGIQADLTRSRTPGDISGFGVPITVSQYQAGVGLASWELDFWGRVANLKQAALDNYLASDASRQAVMLSLIGQVANGYLGLRELDERLALTRETINTREYSYRIFKRRYEVGAISKFDLTQIEALWQQAKALGAELEQARATQADALQLLVGVPLNLPQANAKLDDNAVLDNLPAGLPSDLLVNRPDITAAEYQLRAANANIGAARADFFPRITLTGAFGTASIQLDNLFTGPSRAWNFSPSISLPIFDMGRRMASLDVTKAQRDQAVTSYEKAVQSAFRDVADALAARKWLADQIVALRATVEVQAERARLARLRYDHGASPFLEVLDAQRDLLAAQQQLVQTRRALLSSRVALYTALGGGTRLYTSTPDS